MSKATAWRVGLCSAVLSLATTYLAAPASSASATPTYQGIWYEATADTCTQVPVSGRWSVTLKQDGTASVSVTMFMDGVLHAAWGGNAFGSKFTWTRTATGYHLAMGQVELTIEGDQIRFDIPDRYPACDASALGGVATGSLS